MNISRLIELHELAKKEGEKFPEKRDIFSVIANSSGRHFVGITGPRGSGKSVLLKQLAAQDQDSFYLSMDVLGKDQDSFALIQTLSQKFHFQRFLLDEIHFLPDSSGLLKQLYDFLGPRVIFTSSVALAMHAPAQDLSRRVILNELRNFSFREYLRFKAKINLPCLGLADLEKPGELAGHLRTGIYFEAFLKGGILPFALDEAEPLPLLENILERIIARDLPSVMRFHVDELETIQKLVRFIGKSAVEDINYSCLSRNLGITKYKAEQYCQCLQKAFVLQQVFPAGTNVLREPKILLSPPCRLLYREFGDAIGGLREDFFVSAIFQSGRSISYLKSPRGAKTPDYLLNENGPWVFEVGGRGKGMRQFKDFTAERKMALADILHPERNRTPLFLAGFLGASNTAAGLTP
ncbi:MAG: AAA family ATPase [Verrucomicrobiae bacterium]|nr:AAA family ATPase [Verrucomicrobiae bacterium]